MINKIKRILRARDLSPESRIVAALIYMSGKQALRGNIVQLCTVIEIAKSQCALLNDLQFVGSGRGVYSERVEKAIKEMQAAGFARWNKGKNVLHIDRTGPVHDRFVRAIRQLPHFDACRNSIREAAGFIGFILGSP
jgi:hypothetical protein